MQVRELGERQEMPERLDHRARRLHPRQRMDPVLVRGGLRHAGDAEAQPAQAQDRRGVVLRHAAAALIRSRLSSRPSAQSTALIGGLVVLPVSATRSGCATSLSLTCFTSA